MTAHMARTEDGWTIRTVKGFEVATVKSSKAAGRVCDLLERREMALQFAVETENDKEIARIIADVRTLAGVA